MNEKIIGLGLEICIAVMHIMYVDYYSSASIWYNKKSHLWASKRDERHTVQSALASRFQLPRDLPNFSTIFHNMELEYNSQGNKIASIIIESKNIHPMKQLNSE